MIIIIVYIRIHLHYLHSHVGCVPWSPGIRLGDPAHAACRPVLPHTCIRHMGALLRTPLSESLLSGPRSWRGGCAFRETLTSAPWRGARLVLWGPTWRP